MDASSDSEERFEYPTVADPGRIRPADSDGGGSVPIDLKAGAWKEPPPARVRQATRGVRPTRAFADDPPASLLRPEPVRVRFGLVVVLCLVAGASGFALRGPLGWNPDEAAESVPDADPIDEPAVSSVFAVHASEPTVSFARGVLSAAVAQARTRPPQRLARDTALGLAPRGRVVSQAMAAMGAAEAATATGHYDRELVTVLDEAPSAEQAIAEEPAVGSTSTPEAAVVASGEPAPAQDAPATQQGVDGSSDIAPAEPAPAVPLPENALAAVREGARIGSDRALAVHDTRLALDDALADLQCDRAAQLDRALSELLPAERASYRTALSSCREARGRRRGLPPRTLE